MLFVRWDPDPSAAVQRTSAGTGTAEGRVAGPVLSQPASVGRKPPRPLSLFLERSFLQAFHLVPVPPRALHSRTLTVGNCQRQWKLSRPLMVFERGRSDAKDERTHAGQITILPPSRQTGMFSSPRATSFLQAFLPLTTFPRPRGQEKRNARW